MKIQKTLLTGVSVLVATTAASQAAVIIGQQTGDAAGIAPAVDQFKSALNNGGPPVANAPAPVNNPDGFRAINWDAAPGAVSDPNAFPGDFFNADFAPRARGMAFSGSGIANGAAGFLLSSTAAEAASAGGQPTRFSRFNPDFENQFSEFSPERLFSPINGNTFDINFFNPANPSEPAVVDGFGAVFVDVDTAGATTMEFFDVNDQSLGLQEIAVNDQGFTFASGLSDTAEIARVRIVAGTISLGLGASDDPSNGRDVVVFDDFIAGEMVPVSAIPEPSSSLALAGLLALGIFGRRRR